MKVKTLLLWIVLSLALIFLLFIGFQYFMKKVYAPGTERIAKENVAIIYCSYNNDGVKDLVDIIAKKLKADEIELKVAVPYPEDNAAFLKRIDKENEDVSKVVLSNKLVDFKNYKVVVFGTPVIQKHPCPAIQKFLDDNGQLLSNNITSMIVKYKDGEDPRLTMEYFYYKLYNTHQKPGFLTFATDKNQLDHEIQMWFDEMQFTHEEL